MSPYHLLGARIIGILIGMIANRHAVVSALDLRLRGAAFNHENVVVALFICRRPLLVVAGSLPRALSLLLLSLLFLAFASCLLLGPALLLCSVPSKNISAKKTIQNELY